MDDNELIFSLNSSDKDKLLSILNLLLSIHDNETISDLDKIKDEILNLSNLLYNLPIKNSNQMSLCLKLSIKNKLINNLINNYEYFNQTNLFNEQNEMNLIKSINELIIDLSNLNDDKEIIDEDGLVYLLECSESFDLSETNFELIESTELDKSSIELDKNLIETTELDKNFNETTELNDETTELNDKSIETGEKLNDTIIDEPIDEHICMNVIIGDEQNDNEPDDENELGDDENELDDLFIEDQNELDDLFLEDLSELDDLFIEEQNESDDLPIEKESNSDESEKVNELDDLQIEEQNKTDNLLMKKESVSKEIEHLSDKSYEENQSDDQTEDDQTEDESDEENLPLIKTVTDIASGDKDIVNFLRSEFELKENAYLFQEMLYDRFFDKFKVNENKRFAKQSLGKLIRKIFNKNYLKIKKSTKLKNGRFQKIYLNLKANFITDEIMEIDINDYNEFDLSIDYKEYDLRHSKKSHNLPENINDQINCSKIDTDQEEKEQSEYEDEENSGRKTKLLKDIISNDKDIINFFKDNFELVYGKFVNTDDVYNLLIDEFEISGSKQSIIGNTARLIKRIFINEEIKCVVRSVKFDEDDKEQDIYLNLKVKS